MVFSFPVVAYGVSGERRWLTDQCGGGVAQLGEHLLCKQGVVGSSPIASILVGMLAWWACWRMGWRG